MTDELDLEPIKERLDLATEGEWDRSDVPALLDEVERLRFLISEMVRQLMETSVFTAKQIGWSLECVAESLVNTGVQGVFAENAKLRTQIERVRGLHWRAHAVGTRLGLRYEEPCPDCDGKAGTHECGCWSDSDTEFVCAECHRLGSDAKGVYDYTYPCPTIQALDAPKERG